MANNFQVSRNKNKNGLDIYNQKKKVNNTSENLSKDQKLRNGVKVWGSFYKENIHRYIEDYFQVKLHTFQKIVLYLMSKNLFFMLIAARGIGKSFVVALYALAIASLRPGLPVILASGTKGQAQLIITQKIDKELKLKYPNIAREIKAVKTGNNECVVILHNGSTIQAVTSTDSARGFRAGVLVLDEFRLIKEDVLNKVLRPFLNYVRTPKFLGKPEYVNRKKEFLKFEETQEVYISSAWFKNHFIYTKFKAFRDAMCKGREYFVANFPYQLSVHHGLLSEKRVDQMRQEEDFNHMSWAMEMDSLFVGTSENAFFKLEDIQKCRSIVKPFYPLTNLEFLKSKEKKKKSSKQNGEIRLIGMDIAMMSGNENDNTVFTLMRLLPNGENYIRQVPYIESLNGQHSEKQAIRLKQLFNDFEADYVVMDTAGNGLAVYDHCSKVLYDEERDVEYPAWCAMNNEEMKNRVLDKNALPLIYSMKVVKAELNHEIAVNLRTALENKQLRILVDEIQGKEYLLEKQNFEDKSYEDQAFMLRPYIQTSALVNELVNLEYEIRNGFVKLKEVGRNRKDRYSSLAYCNFYARLLEAELKEDEIDLEDDIIYF